LSRLNGINHHVLVFPHDCGDGVQDSRSIIQSCDLVVAEVSYPSTGMGIELGWANACGKAVIAVHKQDIKPSASLNVITDRIYSYSSPDDLVNIVSGYLA